jgi:hypothetical protein
VLTGVLQTFPRGNNLDLNYELLSFGSFRAFGRWLSYGGLALYQLMPLLGVHKSLRRRNKYGYLGCQDYWLPLNSIVRSAASNRQFFVQSIPIFVAEFKFQSFWLCLLDSFVKSTGQ